MAKNLNNEFMKSNHAHHKVKFPDPHSQECGRICLHCAIECSRFAMSMM
ncbi:hypothetical protein [Clostridium thermopalmarium]|nr:hypothetical protein [Clostridium thermopalmarium]